MLSKYSLFLMHTMLFWIIWIQTLSDEKVVNFMLIMQTVFNIITSDLRLVKNLLTMSEFHTLLLKKN